MSSSHSHSPLIQIWFHPKKAMHFVLERMHKRYVHLLMFLGMLAQVISMTIVGPNWAINIAVWVGTALFLSLFFLYAFGGLIKWTGGWLSGKGEFSDIRAAIAWAQIPVIGFIIIQELVVAVFKINNSSYAFATFFLILTLWSWIIGVGCLAEAQKFSFFRALINYILAILIVIVTAVVIILIVSKITNPT